MITITGTFLNGSLNACVSCKKGTYQPNAQQTSCIPCPINTSTKGIASVSCVEFPPIFMHRCD